MMNGLLIIFILILISAFFSVSEIALAAARKHKLQQMSEDGDKRADLVLALQERPGDFFTVVQVGVNAVAILGGILGEPTFSPVFKALFIQSGVQAETAETLGFLLSFTVVTGLFIQFADLIPKRIGMAVPEATAIKVVAPILFCIFLMRPLVFIFDGIANMIFNAFNLPAVRRDEITTDDIVAMADAGAMAGTVRRKEHNLIENVFELETRTVTSVMTARESVIFFSLNEKEETIRARMLADPHSKFLLCENSIDSVFAYIDAKDILQLVLKGGEINLLEGLKQCGNRKLLTIPDTLSLSEVLEQFKEAREDFAVILNEYALVVGIITLNDVTIQLMGSMVDPGADQIVQRDESSWLVDGVTPIEDVKKALDIDELKDEENYETIAGFMMYMLKRIPKKAELLIFGDYKFEVVDIDNYRIDQLLVTRITPQKKADSE
jgi:CBS domain containing-hemolysin-like protein